MSRRLSVPIRFIWILLLVFGISQWSSPANSAGPVPLALCTEETARIMPLGDSITRGSSSGETDNALQTSYRKDLFNSLNTSGYSVDFVGSLTSGEDVVPSFDPQHEGHAGWTDSQIALNIYNNGGENWLSDLGVNWPHIILLHIGTNVLNEDPSDVEAILNEIDEYEADTDNHITVILARIIDRVPNINVVHKFNNNVQAMAEARAGDDIVIVDMEDGAGLVYQLQPDGDFIDLLHPYHFGIGYTKMAAVWHDAVVGVFATCNHPPIITSDPGDQDSPENTAISLDFEATEQDAGQTLSWSATELPGGLSIDPVSGLISGTIDYDASDGSPYPTVVTVHDSGNPSASDTYSFSWTVTNTNRPPVATDDGYVIDEDNDLDFTGADLLLNDTDPDGGDDLSVSEIDPNSTAGGTIEDLGSDNYRYTPAANFNETDTFTYSMGDGFGGSDTAAVTVTVKPVNDAPVADAQSVTTGFGTPVDITLTASDIDSDNLTFETVGLPLHGTISGAQPELTYTPDAGYSGADSFTFKANDGIDDSISATISITVNENQPPQVTPPGPQNGTEGDPVSLKINAYDVEGHSLSFSIAGQPPDLQIDPGTGIISGELASKSAVKSPYSVTVTVNDGHDNSAVVFAWTVQAAPHLFLPMITVFR